MSDEYYSTKDFGFSTFLKAEGIDLREVAIVDEDTNRCKFVFRIKKDSEELKNLIKEWRFSDRVKRDKRILYASKVLKKALRDYLIEYNNKDNNSQKGNIWQ